MGTSKLIDSNAAFLFEVPGSNSPLVVQELQIGALVLAALAFNRVHIPKWRAEAVFRQAGFNVTFQRNRRCI